MAPEQLEGSEADARTDIFAFGAVLYEMATGRRAFEGASRASLIASIMSSQPRAISELQPMTPPALERLTRKCLAKDPDERWQSAADVADELRWITAGGSQTGIPAPLRAARKHRERFWAWTSALLAMGCLALTVVLLSRSERPARRIWSTIPAPDEPEETTIVASGDLGGPVVISPDGTTLALVAATAGSQQLWVRSLESASARRLPGTEGATFPFWSADSRSLGYFTSDKLYTIGASGGPPVPICNATGGRGGTWNRDGVILLAPAFRSALLRIPATGGTLEPVTTLDETKHTSHRWPTFCPDGKHFLFLAVAHGGANAHTNAVYLGSLDGEAPKLVMQGSSNAAMTSNYILFPRENTLLAAPFDVATAKLIGDPTVVATGVMNDATVWRSAFSVSDHGELVFHFGTLGGEFQPVVRDRAGKETAKIGDPQNLGSIRLSPDGKRLACAVTGAETDLWIYDLTRKIRSRLTFSQQTGAKVEPVWTPDGQAVIYASIPLARPDAPSQICRRPATGGEEEVLYSAKEEVWPDDLSFDGKYLLLSQGRYIGGTPCDIWVFPLEGDRKAYPLVKTPFLESNACFSPDGKWVAYRSNETGVDEVYVIPFRPEGEGAAEGAQPFHGGRWQVSTRGGSWPRWVGKELFFVSGGDSKLTAVEITPTGNGIEIGPATTLFTVSQPAGVAPFDVGPGGQWFVETAGTAQVTLPIQLITNWDAELSSR
jgi:Tol biopolymer transport system component